MTRHQVARCLWVVSTVLIALSWFGVVSPGVGWGGFGIGMVASMMGWGLRPPSRDPAPAPAAVPAPEAPQREGEDGDQDVRQGPAGGAGTSRDIREPESAVPGDSAPPAGQTNREIVSHYLAVHRAGQGDDAYHALIGFGAALIPDLISAYEDADSAETRAFLIEVVSHARSPDAAGFLRHALRRPEEVIWKRALDGLVTLRAADDLEHVLTATQDEPKRSWITEGISQCRESGA